MLVGLVFSGRSDLIEATVVGGLDLCGCGVVELAVEALFVEPADPTARRDLEVIEPAPRPAVGPQRGGVAVQFGGTVALTDRRW